MAIKKINKYFDKMKAESPYYFIIIILYPSFKRAYFLNKWKWWPQQWKYAKQYIETLFNDYINKKVDKEDEELIKLISNNLFSLTEGLFIYRVYYQYREYVKNNLSKCWIKNLTNFKLPVERIRNDIIPLITIIKTDLNKLKAYIIVAVKLTNKLN